MYDVYNMIYAIVTTDRVVGGGEERKASGQEGKRERRRERARRIGNIYGKKNKKKYKASQGQYYIYL